MAWEIRAKIQEKKWLKMGIVKPSSSVAFADEKIMDAWKEVEKTDLEFAKHPSHTK